MKNIFKTFYAVAGMMLIFSACNKVDELPVYGNGTAPVLSASAANIAPAAADSSSDVVSFSWTYPNHATDSANHKYVLQIATVGDNFEHATTITTLLGALNTTMTGKQLNTILLDFGFQFNVAYDVEVRLISSYGNNNEQLISNVLTLNVTPYKIPPAVPLPTTSRLFITGGGSYFDWTNPDPMPPTRELTRLDETTWAAIFHMHGSGNYLLLPLAGDWSNKYSVADNSIPGSAESGPFGFNLAQDIPGNFALGDNWYKVVFDFQHGIHTAIKVDNALSEHLFITGDAVPSSWTNTPPASQEFTQLTNGVFELTVAFTPGHVYKFLDTYGQWQPQFGGTSDTGGTFGSNYGGGADPDAIPTPATAGNYKITVNFITGTYSVVLQ